MKERSRKEMITDLKVMLDAAVCGLGESIKNDEYSDIGYWTSRIRSIERKISYENKLPIDEAIEGKESEYEDVIELHKTYGGD